MEESKINELIQSNSYLCLIGSSDIKIFVPYGSLESFVNMCIRSGNCVTIISRKSDQVF